VAVLLGAHPHVEGCPGGGIYTFPPRIVCLGVVVVEIEVFFVSDLGRELEALVVTVTAFPSHHFLLYKAGALWYIPHAPPATQAPPAREPKTHGT